jgi:hypothetical protein
LYQPASPSLPETIVSDTDSAATDTSSSYWPVYKFFASQSLHNRKIFKKKIRRCK